MFLKTFVHFYMSLSISFFLSLSPFSLSLSHTHTHMYTYTQVEGNSYFDVVAGQDVFSQTPVLLIVVGTFVLLLGIVGIVGSIFASTVAGRIILGLVNTTY